MFLNLNSLCVQFLSPRQKGTLFLDNNSIFRYLRKQNVSVTPLLFHIQKINLSANVMLELCEKFDIFFRWKIIHENHASFLKFKFWDKLAISYFFWLKNLFICSRLSVWRKKKILSWFLGVWPFPCTLTLLDVFVYREWYLLRLFFFLNWLRIWDIYGFHDFIFNGPIPKNGFGLFCYSWLKFILTLSNRIVKALA